MRAAPPHSPLTCRPHERNRQLDPKCRREDPAQDPEGPASDPAQDPGRTRGQDPGAGPSPGNKKNVLQSL
jgi:hypothetical protein